MTLPLAYYQNKDVIFLGKDLLGKRLITEHGQGIIIETESYMGPEDKASHAYNMRRTTRNEVMYHSGGVAYVYICYGMHYLFNVVTGPKELPHAVLIRGLLTQDRVPIYGPGKLSSFLHIDKSYNGVRLDSKKIRIEEAFKIPEAAIESLPRIGIDYAEEHALLPYRFKISKDHSEHSLSQ